MDEKKLIEAAQKGSLEAFNELVLAYQDMIYHHAYFMMRNRETTEDVTQEAFIRAYRSLGTYRGGKFRVWLLRIATNACYDELRRWKRTEWLPLMVTGEENEEMDEPAWLIDPQPLPEENFEQKELRQTLQRQLEVLPMKYRTVIDLVDVVGLEYAEAAQVLGVPIGTIKSRLARAHLQMRGQLKGSASFLPASFAAAACAAC